MNRYILTTVTDDYYHVYRIDKDYYEVHTFAYYDNIIYVVGHPPLVRALARDMYKQLGAIKNFEYIEEGKTGLLKLDIAPGHNFLELDFTEFNLEMYGEESKHFIWK